MSKDDTIKFKSMEPEINKKVEINSETPVVTTTNKYVWYILGLAVAVVAIVVVGIAIGVYINTKESIIKERKMIDNKLDQQMSVYNDRKMVVYQTEHESVKATTNDDYNTFLEVTKLSTPTQACFVSVMNDTIGFDPSTFKMPDQSMNLTNMTTVYYQAFPMRVTDMSFMNQMSKDMCSGLEVYWMRPMCSDKEDKSSLNAKRSTCRKVCKMICKRYFRCSQYCWVAEAACFLWKLIG